MKKIVLVFTLFMSSLNAFANCDRHYKDYLDMRKKIENGQKLVAVSMGAVSFFTAGLGVFFTSAIGASTLALMDKEAKKHWKKYQDCLQNIKDEIERIEVDNQRRIADEARARKESDEAKRKEDKEKMEKEKI